MHSGQRQNLSRHTVSSTSERERDKERAGEDPAFALETGPAWVVRLEPFPARSRVAADLGIVGNLVFHAVGCEVVAAGFGRGWELPLMAGKQHVGKELAADDKGLTP